MLKWLDKLAIKWLIKRNIILNINGDFIKINRKKILNYLESVENAAWDAQFDTITLQNNSWDKDCGDRILENLKVLYHFVHSEKISIENPPSSSEFWDMILKGEKNGQS